MSRVGTSGACQPLRRGSARWEGRARVWGARGPSSKRGDPTQEVTTRVSPHGNKRSRIQPVYRLSPIMRPNTRSAKRALGPAVSRVPAHVLSLIFSFNCETPEVSRNHNRPYELLSSVPRSTHQTRTLACRFPSSGKSLCSTTCGGGRLGGGSSAWPAWSAAPGLRRPRRSSLGRSGFPKRPK